MRPPGSIRFVLVAAALAASGWTGRASDGPARPDIGTVVAHVGERVAAYYHRAQQLICLERSTVVPIDANWTVQGAGRTVESELRVELEAFDGGTIPDAQVTARCSASTDESHTSGTRKTAPGAPIRPRSRPNRWPFSCPDIGTTTDSRPCEKDTKDRKSVV